MQPMKMARPVAEEISPPSFRLKNHMLRQKPPRRHPKPSVRSAKTRDRMPKMTPVTKAATKKAPWTPLETGGFIRKTINTVTASAVRYAAEPDMYTLIRVSWHRQSYRYNPPLVLDTDNPVYKSADKQNGACYSHSRCHFGVNW
jgi:hypothetical protein